MRTATPRTKHDQDTNTSGFKSRIPELKLKHPSWEREESTAMPLEERSQCHGIKRYGLLIRIKAKPQPKRKKFRRKHVDSMWQETPVTCVLRAWEGVCDCLPRRLFELSCFRSASAQGCSRSSGCFETCTTQRKGSEGDLSRQREAIQGERFH